MLCEIWIYIELKADTHTKKHRQKLTYSREKNQRVNRDIFRTQTAYFAIVAFLSVRISLNVHITHKKTNIHHITYIHTHHQHSFVFCTRTHTHSFAHDSEMFTNRHFVFSAKGLMATEWGEGKGNEEWRDLVKVIFVGTLNVSMLHSYNSRKIAFSKLTFSHLSLAI